MSSVLTPYPEVGRVVFSVERIAARVRELAQEIEAHYPLEEELLVVGLLKGAFVFSSDLVRALVRRSVAVDFIIAAHYGEGTDSRREVRLLHDADTPIEGRHVLLVEDIVDSGKTLNRIAESLERRSPASLEICALLHKRLAKDLRFEPRWVGFDAPSDWLVGYGLDLGERYRHLPFIAVVDPEEIKGQ
ncbi:MAG: hypoxanthine phosphoribosyltransferase [Gemmatimonadota bacterium]